MRVTHPFLICHDYGAGGLWAVVNAANEAGIHATLRDITVLENPPDWIDERQYAEILESTGFDIFHIPADHWLHRFVR